MTTEAAVAGTVDAGMIVAGMIDELAARVGWLNEAQSGPGPPAAVPEAATTGPAVAVVIAGRRVEPGTAPVLVGRAASTFGLDHPRVSRRHVGVQLVGGVLIGTDLGSRNGTWLVRDGERSPLTAMAVLRPGDLLVTLDDVELVRVVDLAADLDVDVGGSP